MANDQPHLPLGHYQLTFRAGADLSLPAYPRGLWHGVFGANLKRIACLIPDTECRRCPLLHQCGYSYLFSGPRPPDAEMMRRYDTIPVPHIFRVDTPLPPVIPAGTAFSVCIVLVAQANERLPLVVRTMAAAGAAGLGAERTRAVLAEVTQLSLTGSTLHYVWSEGRTLSALPPDHPAAPPVPQGVRIRFRAPYKPSGNAAIAEDMDPGRFLMSVVRRISLLQYFYTGNRLDADFPGLKAMSQKIQVIGHELRFQPGRRTSASHGTRVDTSGFLGHIDISPEGLAPLWPYLHLGQWLGVGKNASMGFGRYELLPFSPP